MAISDKNIRITTNKNKATGYPNIVFTGSSAGTSVLTLEVRDDNTVAFTGLDGDVFSLDYNLSTGTIWSVNDKSGTPFLRASAGGTIGIAELGSNVIVGIGQTNPKYKLDVQGWVGFASTGDGSYTVLVENGLATGNNAFSIRAANSLRFYNSNNTLYTGFKGAQSGVNTTYTLPPTTPSGTATSYLSSSVDGVMAWVAAPTSGGSGSVNSGTATYAAYYATTTNSVSQNANLQFTGTGVSVGGNINSSSTTTGSLLVWGGLGITGNAFIGGTVYVPSTTPSNISNLLVSNSTVSTSTSSGALVITGGVGIGGSLYTGTGSSSSISGVVLANGNVAATTYNKLTLSTPANAATLTLANNSTLATSGAFSLTLTTTAASNVTFPTAGTLTTTGNDLSVFASTTSAQLATLVSDETGTAGKLVFSTSPTFSTSVITDSASFDVFNTTATTVNAFGAATALNLGQTTGKTTVRSTDVSTSTSTGSLVVSGGAGIAGSLYTGVGFSSSISGVVLANGNVSATTYNKLTLSAPANTATLTLANNSSLVTSGAFSLTLTTTAASNVTFPTAGTLTTTGNDLSVFASTTSAQLATLISDETGTAGKLVFSTSPTFSTSVITDSATLAVFNTTATTINAFGQATVLSIGAATGKATINSTDNSTSTTTGAFVITGGSAIGQSLSVGGRLQMFNGANYTSFLSSATSNVTYTLPPTAPSGTGTSYLSASTTGVMAWVAAPTSGSATIPGGSSGQIQYNNGSFGGIAGFTYNANAVNDLIINTPFTVGTSGVLNIGPGPFDGSTTPGQFNGPSNGTLLAINSGSGYTGNFITAQRFGVSGFAVSFDGKITIGNNVWSLPITSGSAGQVLTSNGNGTQASWTTVTGSSGAGSGTVAIPGAQYQVAAYYWSATGASVSGSSTFTNNTSTGTVNITHTTPSSSTSTGALVVSGSVGVGGSLYVGGQINQTYQPVSGAAIDHAIFIQSQPVPTTVGALIQIGSANKWDGTTAGFFTGSFSGTYIGVNAALGNTADFLNFQQNGQPVFKVGAGGTTFQIGQPLDYPATDVLASFKSTVNSYAQFIIQNKSNGASASADFVLNNDQSNDTTFYGNLGMNSSAFSGTGALAAPNAVYLSSTSGPLVLGTTTADPIRFVVNGGATDVLYISESGTAISCFTNFGMRNATDLRFWNSGSTFYAGLQGGGQTVSYLLTMPTAPVGVGASVIVVGSDGLMYFSAPGSGIAFSSATANTPLIRAKRSLNIQFTSGFTPAAAGADSAIIRVPESASDGTTVLTYNLRRFQVRVETPSAGSSRLQLERSSTDTGAFTLAASGSSHIGGLGVTITGAGIYLTSVTTFSGSLVTSGNLLRLNWTLLNATHANFSVNLILEEV